jgi:hypothetical protein
MSELESYIEAIPIVHPKGPILGDSATVLKSRSAGRFASLPSANAGPL